MQQQMNHNIHSQEQLASFWHVQWADRSLRPEYRLGCLLLDSQAIFRFFHLKSQPTIVHTIICRPLAEQARARSQASAWEICGGQSGTLRYLGFFPLSITTIMFHPRSYIYHWRYRTLATDILALKMAPIHHSETSVTNYPLKLGNNLGHQKPQNTSTPRIYLYTNFNIINFHWYINPLNTELNPICQ